MSNSGSMKRTISLIVMAFLVGTHARIATCATQELAPEATATPEAAPNKASTPAPNPVFISIDDHSEYSACNGEVSEIAFSCECEPPAAKIRKLTKKQRARAVKSGKRNKKNFDACLRQGIYEDTRAGSSCGHTEVLRAWCERYHAGQQNCCAAECVENQARYCCQRHCGRGKFKVY